MLTETENFYAEKKKLFKY